ncbi:MAG: alpha/beta hydrolase [Amylibacter sp.]|nr:alpha/beta hydrolase [Amylibacter sp.]
MTDWDDAFNNSGYIPNAPEYFAAWEQRAKAFRESGIKSDLSLDYGPADRQKLDLFHPATKPKGLVVFVHGGYWMKLNRSYFSHLAAGPLANGRAVAIPSYTLAPDARISGITREIAQAVMFAASRIDGPIHLSGHSAGGHLVARMICTDSPIDPVVQARIAKVVSISGVHDLRNLVKTKMNDMLQLTPEEATAESPCLGKPIAGANVTCWVGADERPEFIRQSHLLHDMWGKQGATMDVYLDPDKHHFNVIGSLNLPNSKLTQTLLGK